MRARRFSYSITFSPEQSPAKATRLVALALALITAVINPVLADPGAPDFVITPIALTTGKDGTIAEPAPGISQNATGEVAYVGSTPTGQALLLRNTLGLNSRIVGIGDPLAGSTIARLVAMPNSLDIFRQVLFYAVLADGRAGLFRAGSVPQASLVAPSWGYRDRPVAFHLTGDGFAPGIQIRFGNVNAGLVTVISRTELTGFIAAGSPVGVVDVTVSRPGAEERKLPAAFEFRDPYVSGCRGFWPDHRPPDVTASSVVSSWFVPWGLLGAYGAIRRWRRRSRRAGTERLEMHP